MNSEVKKYLSAIGRRGGAAKSPAKARASAANGRKGGRPAAPYSIRRSVKQDYEISTVRNRETGETIAEYRMTPGSERAEIAGLRRAIDRHLAKPGGTLGNYGW